MLAVLIFDRWIFEIRRNWGQRRHRESWLVPMFIIFSISGTCVLVSTDRE